MREYDRQGVVRIGGFARCEVANVMAAAEIPKSAAYFASRQLLRRLMVVAFVLVALVALVATPWSRRVTRSIAHLAEATRAIGEGRFEVDVKAESRDEIGMLAQSFNQMAHELHARDVALREAQTQLVQSLNLILNADQTLAGKPGTVRVQARRGADGGAGTSRAGIGFDRERRADEAVRPGGPAQ